MALIKCNECGNQMSDRATECPHCGCPIDICRGTEKPSDNFPSPKPKKRGRYAIIGLLTIIVLTIGAYLCIKNDVFASNTLKITPEFAEAIQKYDQVDAFSEGMAAVRRDGKWGYINLQGEEMIPCQFSDAFPPGQFSDGLACVVDERSDADKKLWNKRVGFINKKGEWVITGDYFTEAPSISAVWEEDSHKLPSFKDGKCAVWNTAVFSLDGDTDSGWSKEYEANKIVLIDKNGKSEEVADSIGYKMAYYRPFHIVEPYKDIAKCQEKKVVYDDYAITIARDTTECDNSAKLVTWQILDANNYPYQTGEKTVQYFIDNQGNSTLSSAQTEAMEQHLNGLVASVTDKHNKYLEEERRRQEEEERIRREGRPFTITLSADIIGHEIHNATSNVGLQNWGLTTTYITVPYGHTYTFKRYTITPKDEWRYVTLFIARNGHWNDYNLKSSGEITIYEGEKFYVSMKTPWGYGLGKVINVNASFYFTDKSSEY